VGAASNKLLTSNRAGVRQLGRRREDNRPPADAGDLPQGALGQHPRPMQGVSALAGAETRASGRDERDDTQGQREARRSRDRGAELRR
jgi:hypothetical protein